MERSECPFCNDDLRPADDTLVFVRPDRYPVTDGHTLVVLTRHEGDLLATTSEEWRAMFDLVRSEALRVRNMPDVDGVNIGANVGAAAGQTVDHAHIHVIPRTTGDQLDPRGGVRRVLESEFPF